MFICRDIRQQSRAREVVCGGAVWTPTGGTSYFARGGAYSQGGEGRIYEDRAREIVSPTKYISSQCCSLDRELDSLGQDLSQL